MKYPIFAIRDVKTGYMQPTIDQNDSSAIRNFEHACMQANSLMCTHAEHYSLYRIGVFDTETGEVSGCQPVHLVDATEVI